MVYFYLFIVMLFLHLFADFTLQGWFAQGKQRSWWKKQCEDANVDFRKYKYDYLCALIGHSVYWAILTFAPVIFLVSWPSVACAIGFVIFQTAVHAIIDDLKANRFKLNLWHDQAAHLAQIIFALVVFGFLGCYYE